MQTQRSAADDPHSFALKARYVFPVDSPPLGDGVLSIRAGKIAAVGKNTSGSDPLDLGNVAILPGLVNAHTHLEFSDLEAPLGRPGMGFARWIRTVIDHRRQQTADPQTAVQCGLAECARLGTTTLGEIASPAGPCDELPDSPLGGTVFAELIGLSADKIDPLLDRARRYLQQQSTAAGNWHKGLSPHAPYTAHPELVSRLAGLSTARRAPLAMHLAESAEEIELLRSGNGPLVDLLRDLDAWDTAAIARGSRPLDYLTRVSVAQRVLVIHGNYLDEQEIDFLAQHAGHMSLVYCPRTHAYFQHPPYPLSRLLAAGVNVVLGTDSRASNPDLSVLQEMRYVARHHTDIAPETLLRLGTAAAAKALGHQQEIGTLAVGKQADLTVVRLPERPAGDPHELLFDSEWPVVETYVRGCSAAAPAGH